MSTLLIIPDNVYQQVEAEADAIIKAMTDLERAMSNGDLMRVAAHIVVYVGGAAGAIKEAMRGCILEDRKVGGTVPFEIPTPDGCDMDEEAYKDELNLEDEIARTEAYYDEH